MSVGCDLGRNREKKNKKRRRRRKMRREEGQMARERKGEKERRRLEMVVDSERPNFCTNPVPYFLWEIMAMV